MSEFPRPHRARFVPPAWGRFAPPPKRIQLIHTRDGRIFRVLFPAARTGFPKYGVGPTFTIQAWRLRDNQMGKATRIKIDQGELGKTIDMDPPSPVRLIGGRVIASYQPPEPYLPKFVENPTLSTYDDCLVVSWAADKEVQAVIYYAIVAQEGQTLGELPRPAPPRMTVGPGSGGPDFRKGYFRYAYFFDNGGYDAKVAVEVLDKEHSYPICGLISGATYTVMVSIFDKDGKGPVFSEDVVLQLPNLD